MPVSSSRNVVTPWSRVVIEKLVVAQSVKKFPVFYGIRRFMGLLCSQEPVIGLHHDAAHILIPYLFKIIRALVFQFVSYH
jgi:hypothetical protein